MLGLASGLDPPAALGLPMALSIPSPTRGEGDVDDCCCCLPEFGAPFGVAALTCSPDPAAAAPALWPEAGCAAEGGGMADTGGGRCASDRGAPAATSLIFCTSAPFSHTPMKYDLSLL